MHTVQQSQLPSNCGQCQRRCIYLLYRLLYSTYSTIKDEATLAATYARWLFSRIAFID